MKRISSPLATLMPVTDTAVQRSSVASLGDSVLMACSVITMCVSSAASWRLLKR